MAHHHESIKADRLFDAAEAVLLAMTELQRDGVRHPMDVVSVMGTARQPHCLQAFCLWEITEATDFLIRLGFLPNPGRGPTHHRAGR